MSSLSIPLPLPTPHCLQHPGILSTFLPPFYIPPYKALSSFALFHSFLHPPSLLCPCHPFFSSLTFVSSIQPFLSIHVTLPILPFSSSCRSLRCHRHAKMHTCLHLQPWLLILNTSNWLCSYVVSYQLEAPITGNVPGVYFPADKDVAYRVFISLIALFRSALYVVWHDRRQCWYNTWLISGAIKQLSLQTLSAR